MSVFYIYASNMGDTSYMQLLSAWNVASASKELVGLFLLVQFFF